MERYANGDPASFAEVYDAVAPHLLRCLQRRVRDPARAEDLLQRTFLHMHRSRGTFLRGTDVLPWAYAIARRLCIDELRRGSRDPMEQSAREFEGVALGMCLADAEYHARETAKRLQTALESLPSSQRTAFELLRLDGLSHEQAAQVLGTTISAVKLRAHRAYQALHRALDEKLPE